MTSSSQARRRTSRKVGRQSPPRWTSALPSRTTATSGACTEKHWIPSCQRAHHPFAHVFEKTSASACQHRTNDYWHHDLESKTWTRVHLQPRKKLYEPIKEGDRFRPGYPRPSPCLLDTPVCVTALNADGHVLPQEQCDALRYQADYDLRPNCFWTGCTIFEYGEPNDACTLHALASKMRPGPHRGQEGMPRMQLRRSVSKKWTTVLSKGSA